MTGTDPTGLTPDILDALEAGVVVLDAEQRIRHWNAWLARASGLAGVDMAGRMLWDVFPDLRGSRFQGAVEDVLEMGVPSVLSHTLHAHLLPLRCPDGRPLLHNVVVRPLAGGCCLVQVTDVTAVIERERVLRERRDARYRAVVDTAQDAILMTDAEGTIQWLNGAAERQFGWRIDEAVGRDVGLLLAEADAGRWPRDTAAQAIPMGDGADPVELVGCRRDGSLVDLELSLARWTADGRRFVTGIFRDITERRRAQEALAARELTMRRLAEQTQATLDALPALVAVLDRAGRIVSVNRTWADAVKAGEFPGRGVGIGDDYLETCKAAGERNPDLAALHAKLRDLLEQGGPSLAIEYASHRPDRMRWYRCLAAPILPGLLGGAVVMHVDITEGKQLQQALEQALGDKTMLLREVNHRVKNSLQLVSSLLRLQSATVGSDSVRHHFQDARSRIDAIAQVHQRLYQTEKFRTLDFAAYLKELCDDLVNVLGGSDICDIRLEAESVDVPVDMAAPLGLIANELITNAIKHGGEGPACVRVSLRRRSNELMLTVADEGPGLPENFDPARVPSLGMRIVTSLVRQIGGRLDIPPAERGAAFQVASPLAEIAPDQDFTTGGRRAGHG